jgi:hypothetical protein
LYLLRIESVTDNLGQLQLDPEALEIRPTFKYSILLKSIASL